MPEGHALRRLADRINEVFAGGPVTVSSPQGRFAAEAAALDGSELESATSAGKHLFIEFAGERIIHIHLGLIGSLNFQRVTDGEVPPVVGVVRLRLANHRAVADLRGATRCDLVGPRRRAEVLSSLGPDPLDPDGDAAEFVRRVGRSRRSIGDLLMDQAVLAGVGNVYRAEVLYRQGLDPFRPGNDVDPEVVRAIWEDLVVLMAEGVQTGRIDTVRPEHTPEAMGREPRVDDHGGEVYVYRRAGQACLVCSTEVATRVLGGRNLFWCPTCQPER